MEWILYTSLWIHIWNLKMQSVYWACILNQPGNQSGLSKFPTPSPSPNPPGGNPWVPTLGTKCFDIFSLTSNSIFEFRTRCATFSLFRSSSLYKLIALVFTCPVIPVIVKQCKACVNMTYIYEWRTKLWMKRKGHQQNWVVPYRLWGFGGFPRHIPMFSTPGYQESLPHHCEMWSKQLFLWTLWIRHQFLTYHFLFLQFKVSASFVVQSSTGTCFVQAL